MAICFGDGGGRIYQAFGECVLFLQRTSSSIGDGLNSEGGVFWGDEVMIHSTCVLIPSRGISMPSEDGC